MANENNDKILCSTVAERVRVDDDSTFRSLLRVVSDAWLLDREQAARNDSFGKAVRMEITRRAFFKNCD